MLICNGENEIEGGCFLIFLMDEVFIVVLIIVSKKKKNGMREFDGDGKLWVRGSGDEDGGDGGCEFGEVEKGEMNKIWRILFCFLFNNVD